MSPMAECEPMVKSTKGNMINLGHCCFIFQN